MLTLISDIAARAGIVVSAKYLVVAGLYTAGDVLYLSGVFARYAFL